MIIEESNRIHVIFYQVYTTGVIILCGFVCKNANILMVGSLPLEQL